MNVAADDVNDLLAAGPEEEGRVLNVPAPSNNGNTNGNNNVNEQSNQNENAIIPGALPQTGVDY